MKRFIKNLGSVEKRLYKEVRNTGLFLNLEAPLPPHPIETDFYFGKEEMLIIM